MISLKELDKWVDELVERVYWKPRQFSELVETTYKAHYKELVNNVTKNNALFEYLKGKRDDPSQN